MNRLSIIVLTTASALAACGESHATIGSPEEDERVEIALARGGPVTLEGTLRVMWQEDFVSGVHTVAFSLERGSRELPLTFRHEAPYELPSGATVRLRGDAVLTASGPMLELGSASDPDSLTVLAVPVAALAGVQTTLALLIDVDDGRAATTADKVSALLFGAPTSIDAFYRDSSFGQVSFAGRVAGPFKVSGSTSTPQPALWAYLADEAARAAGIDTWSYNRHVYVLPSIPVGWAGTADLGGSNTRVFVQGSYVGSSDVYAHELGHNLGMHHAATPSSEYGDGSDVMGGLGGLRQPNAPHKVQMGWSAGSNVQTVTGGGVYTVAPLEQATSAVQVLRIQKPGTYEYLYLGYRRPLGFDATGLYSGYTNRTSVHRWAGSQTYLLASLADGDTFRDQAYGVTVTQTAHDDQRATLHIELSAGPGQATLSLSPSTAVARPGEPRSFSVTLVNGDSGGASVAFALSPGPLPEGWSATVSTPSLVLSSGASSTATLVVTSPADAPGGTSPLSVTASDGTTALHTATASGTLTLDTALPSVPSQLTVTLARRRTVSVTWLASTDDVGVARYEIVRNGATVGSTAGTKYLDAPGPGTHSYAVRAVDQVGNASALSAVGTITR